MSIYLILYTTIILCIFMEYFFSNGKKMSFIVIVCSIICIVGLRSEKMGVDIPGYLKSFDYLSRINFVESLKITNFLNYEKGYILYNSFLGSFTTNIHVFLLLNVAISFFPIAYFAYKNSNVFSYSILIYLSLPPFLLLYSGLRQSIAIGICYFSFEFVKKRKIVPFILVVFIATSFHTSALLFLLTYPIYTIQFDFKKRCISVICLLLVYFFKSILFFILAKILKNNPNVDNNGAFNLMIAFLFIYILCSYLSRNDKENSLLNIFFLACFCQMFSSLNSIAIRVGYYFMLVLIPLIPSTINNIKEKNLKIIANTLYLVFFISLGLFSIYHGSWAQSYPHHWFWE